MNTSLSFKVGITLLSIILAFALLGPFFSDNTYYTTNLSLKNLPPSMEHWFGTDDLGRDLFVRTCYGARISLFIGVAAAIIDLFIGVFWGGFSALYGGKIDECMMRFADVCYSIPQLLVVILLMVVMGSGLGTMVIALTLTGWITMARVVRAQILQLKQQEYVLAARVLGSGNKHILVRHLLPNALPPIICTLTLTIPSAIFSEAFLSFLGLGVQAPIASWGAMASEGLTALEYFPWRALFPLGFITVTMLAFNLLADSMQGE
ncbi:MAG: ABC transporter permease [Chlamydiota bacterium]|nr:ABC transporter permease [Chlamydiota bacterium]